MFERYYKKQSQNDGQDQYDKDLFSKSNFQDNLKNTLENTTVKNTNFENTKSNNSDIDKNELQNNFTLSIGQVSKLLLLPTHTIRFWNDEFCNNIPHIIGKGERRYYNQKSLEIFTKINKLIHKDGLKIKAIKDRNLLENLNENLEKATKKSQVNSSSKITTLKQNTQNINQVNETQKNKNQNTVDIVLQNPYNMLKPSQQVMQKTTNWQSRTNSNINDELYNDHKDDFYKNNEPFYFTNISSKTRKIQRLINDLQHDIKNLLKYLD